MTNATISNVPIAWSARLHPLPPYAVAAIGRKTMSSLVRRLQLRTDDNLSEIQYVVEAESTLLVLRADSEHLPWAEGVLYLGQQPDSSLLLPTTMAPAVPLFLFERALSQRFSKLMAPIAVIPHIPKGISISDSNQQIPDMQVSLLSLAKTAPLRREWLDTWLREWR